MTSAAEKAPLLPHCTAFIPLEKQKRRIYKRRKSPPWAQWELPSPLGQFFLQDGAWRVIIFKLAHQAPSNLPLCEHARPATECEGLTRDARLNASFGRLSGRIGTAALCAPVAQRIERRFPKPCVGGSSPLRGATFLPAVFGFSFLMPTFRISFFPIPPKSTCAWWSDVLTMAPQFQSVTPYDSLWILRETGRRRGLWRIPGKLGAEGARRNTCSQAFR